jgi:hypothetical protein
MAVLTGDQIERFVADGYLHLPAAFPRDLADTCRAILWRHTGCDPDDRSTWTRPVIRLDQFTELPFREAANTATLHGAFDQLVGAGRWQRRGSLGTFPVRFPHPDDPGDAGWHTDGSYAVDGDPWPWHNLRSRGRALLMLFLFSDVGPDDAPTRIRVGSHLDVPAFLAPSGDAGMSVLALAQAMGQAGLLDDGRHPIALATGAAGDVYLCHPFLVHAAQPHRGTVVKFMAQPPLQPVAPELDLDGDSPVERAIRRGLDHALR